MFVTKIFRKISQIHPSKQYLNLFPAILNSRTKCSKKDNDAVQSQDKNPPTNQTLGEMSSKYQVFRDQDAEVILDIYEERSKYASILPNEIEEETHPLEGLNLERGVHGVFEIEDLVDVLRRENAQDILVASVPKEIKYVDFICLTTGKSHKHMQAIAQFVKKVYKKKMDQTDSVPKLEGKNSRDWMALDLGNIALHIFSPEARNLYDLDTLWAVGPQYDKEYNKKDPVAEMLEKHSIYLQDLHPAQ